MRKNQDNGKKESLSRIGRKEKKKRKKKKKKKENKLK